MNTVTDLSQTFYVSLKKLARDKRSSLFCRSISDEKNSLHTCPDPDDGSEIGPALAAETFGFRTTMYCPVVNGIKLFSPSIASDQIIVKYLLHITSM
jgi:hypothetical protein